MMRSLRFPLFCSLSLVTLLGLFVACNKRTSITEEVEKIQATLPLSLGVAGSVTQIADEDSVVALTITLDNKVIDLDHLNVDRQALLEAFGRQFYSSEARQLLQTMADEKVDFLVRYTDNLQKSGKTIRLRAEDLQTIATNRPSIGGTMTLTQPTSTLSPRSSIMLSILESDRKGLPSEVNPGITLVAIDTLASGMRYTTHVDTTKVSSSLLKGQQRMLHDNILTTIRQVKDPTALQTYRLCGEYGIALTFVYTLTNGKVITQVVISPKELLATIKNNQKQTTHYK